jgi:hypothetical protein
LLQFFEIDSSFLFLYYVIYRLNLILIAEAFLSIGFGRIGVHFYLPGKSLCFNAQNCWHNFRLLDLVVLDVLSVSILYTNAYTICLIVI